MQDRRSSDPTVAMDSLLHLESMLEQSGYEDGLASGLLLGHQEGHDLGHRIAVKTGREVGYYLAVCQHLLSLPADHTHSPRAGRVLQATVELIEGLPRWNDHSRDIVPVVEKIRGKFLLAMVLLKRPELKFDLERNAPVADVVAGQEGSAGRLAAKRKQVAAQRGQAVDESATSPTMWCSLGRDRGGVETAISQFFKKGSPNLMTSVQLVASAAAPVLGTASFLYIIFAGMKSRQASGSEQETTPLLPGSSSLHTENNLAVPLVLVSQALLVLQVVVSLSIACLATLAAVADATFLRISVIASLVGLWAVAAAFLVAFGLSVSRIPNPLLENSVSHKLLPRLAKFFGLALTVNAITTALALMGTSIIFSAAHATCALLSSLLLATNVYQLSSIQDSSIFNQQEAFKKTGAILDPFEPTTTFTHGNAFSVLYFTWMNPLMRLGGKRALKLEDLPNLNDTEKAQGAVDRFNEFKHRHKSLWRALFASETRSFLLQMGLATLSTLFGLAGPYFLYRITGYIQNPDQPVLIAFLFAIAFGLSTAFRALCDNHAWHLARKMSIRIKSVLVNEIYCKSLKRIPNNGGSGTAESETEDKKAEGENDASVGKIVTLMSTDAETIRDTMPELYDVILFPLHIFAAIGGLLYVVGWPALAGLAVMVLTLPLTYWNSVWNIRVYEKLLAAQDGRTNVVNEVLQGIRIIKYFAWEKKFLEKIDAARGKELRTLMEMYANGAMSTFIWLVTPLLVSFVTLVTLTKIADQELNSQLAFTCLSLFNSLRIPLMALPYVIADVFQLKVAFGRVTRFLDQDELEKYSENSTNNASASANGPSDKGKWPLDRQDSIDSPVIGFKAGSFQWHAVEGKNVPIEDDTVTSSTVATERTALLCTSASSASLSSLSSSPNTAFTLRDLNVNFPVGSLSVVCGPTGCGKSSLLQALLGEMKRLSGNAYLPDKRFYRSSSSALDGGVAYVAQTSWLQNATIRDNITFGELYDPIRYDKVIKACALVKDLETLEAGDLTEIGEKGINLSGGQKQRISLARAVYSRAQFILMDDPLSAVDAPTAKHLFAKAICGSLMKGRTRILVTHATSLVLKSPEAKFLVVVQGGGVLAAGPVARVVQEPGIAALVGFDGVQHNALQKATSSSSLSSSVTTFGDEVSEEEDEEGMETVKDYGNGKTVDNVNKLIDKEATATGAIDSKFYAKYLWNAGGVLFVALLVLFNVGDRTTMIFNDYWIKLWAEAYDAAKSGNGTDVSGLGVMLGSLSGGGSQWNEALVSSTSVFGILANVVEARAKDALGVLGDVPGHGVDVDYYIRIYALISVVWVCVFLTAYGIRSFGSYRASKRFHNSLIERIVYAPMRFFDTTPIGRILNRLTKDISTIDNGVMRNFEEYLGTIMDAMAVLSVVVAVTPVFLVTLLPICVVYYSVSSRFLACQREIKRLDSVTRSPIYSMFSETLVGVSTIRAYGSEQRFMTENLNRVDTNHRAFFYMWSANRWFGTRVSSIASCVILASAIGTVAMRDIIGAGLAGLSLTWVLSFSDYLVWIVRIQAQLEMNMNAVERVSEYTEIEVEQAAIIESNRPPLNWPSKGALTVSNLEMRYAPDQAPVLMDVSFSISGGQKVGIVGRTGAGKSSLSLSLFRIVEPTQGTITIDGIDISTIGLYDLRSKITMIPQDPILFAGTIRTNLDPFNEYDDAALWSCLKQVRFMESMQSLAAKEQGGSTGTAVKRSTSESTLDGQTGDSEVSQSERTGVTLEASVAEGGNNFSQGQRQLLCLARALLKSSTLTVFDEATASVDNETDANIQLAIRGPSFANTTVLSIAHRLRTIADYDKILVLEKGRVIQFGTPLELMEQEGGVFRHMCQDSGEFDALFAMAKKGQ
ncbi:hypothetical protein HDU98_002550 [Podochytrium sp. JEL0797]|nr:hypothetical protein HDU98_002550 [Podochytrium sp. JEL0797]